MFATVDSKQRRRKRNKNFHKERRQIAPWQINQCSSDMYWEKMYVVKERNTVENIWIYLICCSVNVSHWHELPPHWKIYELVWKSPYVISLSTGLMRCYVKVRFFLYVNFHFEYCIMQIMNLFRRSSFIDFKKIMDFLRNF